MILEFVTHITSLNPFAGQNGLHNMNEYTLFVCLFSGGKDNILYLLEHICKFITEENNASNRLVSCEIKP